MSTEYGQRLREARRSAKLTQEALAKKTGIPQSTISTAERLGHGSSDTPVYANACGVDPFWLATGRGTPSPSPHQLSTAPQIGGRKLASLGETLESLSEHLKSMDLDTRRSAMLLITDLERAPDTHPKVTAMIELSIRLSVPKRA